MIGLCQRLIARPCQLLKCSSETLFSEEDFSTARPLISARKS
jgi:hypothetical protein